MRERNRYLPGLRAWVGYRNSIVYYDRQDRAGGDGKLSFISRIKYAMDAITGFSYKPLRLSFGLFGFSCSVAAVLALSMFLSTRARGNCISRCGCSGVSLWVVCCFCRWVCWANMSGGSMTRCVAARFHLSVTCTVLNISGKSSRHDGGPWRPVGSTTPKLPG